MKRKPTKPLWWAKTCELNRWKKIWSVYMFSGNVCQIVLIDLGDPIGIMMQKPKRISREEGIITGIFVLNEPTVAATKKEKDPRKRFEPHYFVAVYNPRAKAFMYAVPGEQLPEILEHPDIRYVAGEERERTKAVLRLESQPI